MSMASCRRDPSSRESSKVFDKSDGLMLRTGTMSSRDAPELGTEAVEVSSTFASSLSACSSAGPAGAGVVPGLGAASAGLVVSLCPSLDAFSIRLPPTTIHTALVNVAVIMMVRRRSTMFIHRY